MAARPKLDEFELIAHYFSPLSVDQWGALGLRDDAALLSPSPGVLHVLTTDTLISGVHFAPDDTPDLIARKLLRVNLSDLAAMGAEPMAYLLALSLPDRFEEAWIQEFVFGLAQDQKEFGIGLLGGDTTSTPGPLSVTITAIGKVETGRELRRSGARPGDSVFVSGTLGDAALGLIVIGGNLSQLTDDEADELIHRYHLPQPRISLGRALSGLASAAVDVSDGLVADLGHICMASNVAGQIDRARIPLSLAAQAAIISHPERASAVLSGGDDYELLFTAPPEAADEISAAAKQSGVSVTEIGRIDVGSGVKVIGSDGQEINLMNTGFRHF